MCYWVAYYRGKFHYIHYGEIWQTPVWASEWIVPGTLKL